MEARLPIRTVETPLAVQGDHPLSKAFASRRSDSGDDVACPSAALNEGEDQKHAHRQVLERVGESGRDPVDGRSRRGARPGEAAQDEREGDQQDQDDETGQAHRREVLQVADADLARVVERHERERDRAERRHDVELDGARPADHERHDVGSEDHDPADDRHQKQRYERRNVVVLGHHAHSGKVYRAARAEQRHRAVDGEPHHRVDGLHELEAVLYEEQEHREEHQQEHDLLHAGERGVPVHALADLDELHREHQPEHAAADGKHCDVPDAACDVVHGDVPCGREHLREVRADDAVVADAREHRHLVGEHPVARVPQKPGEPCVHVVGDVRVGGRRRDEHERREEQREGEREDEAPVCDHRRRPPHSALSSPDPRSRESCTMVDAASFKWKEVVRTSPLQSM